jgi:hypothetical protein
MTKATPRRACRDHERLWRDLCVDKNLKDDWLERLNRLEAFTLINICEGHADQRPGSPGSYAHISMRLKEWLLPGIARHWEELRGAVLSEMNRLFQVGDTDINMELKFRLRAGRGKLIYQEGLTLRVRSFKKRKRTEMDSQTGNWFEQSITRIEGLDRMVLEWHRQSLEA